MGMLDDILQQVTPPAEKPVAPPEPSAAAKPDETKPPETVQTPERREPDYCDEFTKMYPKKS